MLNKRIINTGGTGAACTTDTTQILNAGSTQSTALYRFEDNVNDTSNSTGKFSKGAVFNGSSSVIQTSGLNQFFNNWNDTSWSAWINTTDTSAQYIACESTDSQNYKLIGSISSNKFQIVVRRSSTVYSGTSTTTMNDGNWHHIVATYESSTGTVKGYIDGSEEISFSTGGASSATFSVHDFCIGANKQGSNVYNPLDGKIDQFRLFNKVISASEVTTLYNETTSTVNTLQVLGDYSCIAAYTFEGNANDLSTNYNGTASNVRYDYSATASNITYATGKFGKSAVFNGSNSLATVSSSLPWANSFSISMWLKPSSGLSASSYYLPFYQRGYDSSIGGTGVAFYMYGYVLRPWIGSISGNYYNIFNTGTLTANQWNHVVLTRSYGVAWELYLNGSSLGTYTAQGLTTNFSDTEYYFGGYFGGAYDYSGEIDQARIFDKALNSGEINSLYTETSTSAASTTINNPSTVAYYKMQDGSDETGSYDATLINNVDFTVQGKYGIAGKFNGTNSYMTTGFTWPGGTQLSWSGWIKTSNTKDTYVFGDFASGGANSSHRFSVRLYSQNFQATINNAGGGLGTSVTFGTFAHYGDWAHLVVTVDGTTLKGYVNGSQLGSAQTSSESLVAGANPFVFGNYGPDTGSAQQFDGIIDQVRIFNKTISAAEVTKLYNEVQCANTIDAPENYFNTKIYSGNGGTQAITGLGFEPDLLWWKARNASNYNWKAVDSINGPTKNLYLNLQNALATDVATTSFDSDGFTFGSGGNGNVSGLNYVTYAWKGGTSSVTNNVGTITSTVSASPESGFSVLKYTATGTIITNTVGHGLTTKPSLIIQKSLGGGSNWFPITDAIDGSVDYLVLNSDVAKGDMTGIYANFSIDDTTFTNWYSNTSGDVITYCFANVDGYQRISSYIGNGSANGPFVYTGFEPAFVLIKRTDSARNWRIIDNKRSTTNPRDKEIYPNLSNADGTYNSLNFHTNGFQVINTDISYNASGGSYLFWAIAANPDTTEPTKANSFKAKAYTGTGSTHAISGLGFKPDFIWTKNRDTTDSSAVVDSVRGIISSTPYLASDTTDAQATSSNMPTSVQADGYTITGAGGRTNTSGEDYVSWNWKAGDHDRNLAAINNDGNITSVVSANPEAGFSVVKWTGTGVDGKTIGHGLGAAPEFIITKGLSNATSWVVGIGGVSGMNVNDYLTLTANAKGNLTNFYQAYSTNTFQVGVSSANEMNKSSSNQYISYCFRSISGISKLGTYTGNGSTTGPSITVGFRPSWVLIKKTSSTGGWYIFDAARAGSTTAFPKMLYPHLNNAEYDTTGTAYDGMVITTTATTFEVDFSSAWTDLNASGTTYLYMTFK